MICPNCNSNYVSHDNDFTYEDCGYEGEGIVFFYTCLNCGALIEVCVPENSDNKRRKRNGKE